MKLNELHVTDLCTRAEGHGYGVSGSAFGVGRVAIELSHPSRGQQNRGTRHLLRQSFLVDQRDAGHPFIFGEELGSKLELLDGNVLAPLDFGPERAQDFSSRGVTRGAQNVAVAVGSFG